METNSTGGDRWPVIIHTSLEKTEVATTLQTQQLLLKYSSSTQENTCIFPLSGIAFLIVYYKDYTTEEARTALEPRIEKLLQIHRKLYVILIAPQYEPDQLGFYSHLQQRFLFTNLNMIPTHNSEDCVQTMLSMAKMNCKPMVAQVHESVEEVLAQYEGGKSLYNTLKTIGLDQEECDCLMERLGSLEAILSASTEELEGCGLPVTAVRKIINFCGQHLMA